MKIITDTNLIQFRIALQKIMYQSVAGLAELIDDLHKKVSKGFPITLDEKKMLVTKIRNLSFIFFEMEFGSYFIKQPKEFQNRVVGAIIDKYIKITSDLSIREMEPYILSKIFIDMEDSLKTEIKAQKDGK